MVKVRADRLCICGAGGAGCALLYNDEETLCWGQAGTNVTDNCQLANGCGYIKCCEVPEGIQMAPNSCQCIKYIWVGTAAQYAAITTKNNCTLYNVI